MAKKISAVCYGADLWSRRTVYINTLPQPSFHSGKWKNKLGESLKFFKIVNIFLTLSANL